MSQQTTPLELSPLSAWVEGELVKLPSGRVYRLRQIDVMFATGDDGSIPNFLLNMLGSKEKQTVETTPDQLRQLAPLLNTIATQSVVEPSIVPDLDAVNRGEGITLSMIPMQDKMGMLNYAMGGEAAVNAAIRFQSKQAQSVGDVPNKKERITEFASPDP